MLTEFTAKPDLIILSDMFGIDGAVWMDSYKLLLDDTFNIRLYDSGVLAQTDEYNSDKDMRHQYFLSGGTDIAVSALLQQETEPVWVLGFSIGGLIAWKAILNDMKAINFIAVSSTRLRYETEIPDIPVYLFYGEHDAYKPDNNWINDMKIHCDIFENAHHDMYKSADIAERICTFIKNCYLRHMQPKL
ncbi:MAG TPA: hypothetical protein PK047_12095 [Saprospiraceae bacterium]|nr:hypothetical protein [Saprospiraceae bacterium]HRO09598.1 hypothetical protein [Saprospiraceae bacterium]HRP42860.1 hypothetical protein [Saprospiraceae bacterium]